MPAWATILGLIDECPTMHAALTAAQKPRAHTISPNGFEFISENGHIAAIHAFVHALPETLRG